MITNTPSLATDTPITAPDDADQAEAVFERRFWIEGTCAELRLAVYQDADNTWYLAAEDIEFGRLTDSKPRDRIPLDAAFPLAEALQGVSLDVIMAYGDGEVCEKPV